MKQSRQSLGWSTPQSLFSYIKGGSEKEITDEKNSVLTMQRAQLDWSQAEKGGKKQKFTNRQNMLIRGSGEKHDLLWGGLAQIPAVYAVRNWCCTAAGCQDVAGSWRRVLPFGAPCCSFIDVVDKAWSAAPLELSAMLYWPPFCPVIIAWQSYLITTNFTIDRDLCLAICANWFKTCNPKSRLQKYHKHLVTAYSFKNFWKL